MKQNKDIAAFSYIWIMSILVYFGRKDSPFIQHHSRQGMILFVLTIPLWFIPIVGQLLEVVLLAGMVMGFINAFQGQWSDVPLVGPVSRGEMSPMQAVKIVVKFLSSLFKQASKAAEKPPANPEPAKGPTPTTPPPPVAPVPTQSMPPEAPAKDIPSDTPPSSPSVPLS